MTLFKMLISLFLVVFLTRPCQSSKTLGLYSQSPGQQRKPPGLTLSPGWQVTVCGPPDPAQSLGGMKKPGLRPGHLGSLDRWWEPSVAWQISRLVE